MAAGTYTTDDPFSRAMNPQERQQERTYFGVVAIVDVWDCVLQKGVGKRPFDPTQDDINQRSTAIKLSIEVEKRDDTTYTIDQDTLDWSKEWLKFTLPSVRQLGIDLRNLKNQYVQIKRENTGETYTNKSGEVKEKSAIVFIAVYPDQQTMKVAADAFYTPRGGTAPSAATATPPDDGEYGFAVQTLGMLWKAVKEDEDKFLHAIGNNPMLVKYFNANSDEVKKYTLGF